MSTCTQTSRPLAVTTPLGKDALLAVSLTGQEGLSQLFTFDLDVLADNRTEVPFDKLLGQPVSARLDLPGGKSRYFHGICSRISQGGRDLQFTSYRLEMVPQFWMLTRKSQSRIFQHLSVSDILKKVLEGLNVEYQIQGTFHPRDFVVQYRESDFHFACRLMEEEGIYYFFKHAAEGHKLVLANNPQSHPDVPGATRIQPAALSGGVVVPDRIHEFQKVQELRSSKYTLWDHCFELPHKHLEADKTIQDSVQVGKVAHKLKAGNNGHLEIYDWPGAFAQRFDGLNRSGAERPEELKKIFEDNQRTVGIRMQQEAACSVAIEGVSNCRQFTAGHRFTLEHHFNADGVYVLTSVRHTVRNAPYRNGSDGTFFYENTFTCIPVGLPFRPPRTTPKPVVHGTQTAVVVGLTDQEIFTDKYGRVKVQFHWDRQGKSDADCSCWVRVAQFWAGKGWGAHFWPRVHHEVIVAFEEGDPNQPIIVGSVYNAENMPPYALPGQQTRSGIKTRSTPQGTAEQFNELRFEDRKGQEEIYLHAERKLNTVVEADESRSVGGKRTTTVHKLETLTVDSEGRETTIKQGSDVLMVQDGRRETYIKSDDMLVVEAGNAERLVPSGKYQVVAKEVMVIGYEKITLQVAGSTLTIEPKGITLTAPEIQSLAVGVHDIKGLPVKINC